LPAEEDIQKLQSRTKSEEKIIAEASGKKQQKSLDK